MTLKRIIGLYHCNWKKANMLLLNYRAECKSGRCRPVQVQLVHTVNIV